MKSGSRGNRDLQLLLVGGVVLVASMKSGSRGNHDVRARVGAGTLRRRASMKSGSRGNRDCPGMARATRRGCRLNEERLPREPRRDATMIVASTAGGPQ